MESDLEKNLVAQLNLFWALNRASKERNPYVANEVCKGATKEVWDEE